MNIFVQLVLFQFDLILYSGIDIKSEGEAGGSTSAEVKSFASSKKCKAKQWKARVTKLSKDKNKKKIKTWWFMWVSWRGTKRIKPSSQYEEKVTFKNLTNCRLCHTMQASGRKVENLPQ